MPPKCKFTREQIIEAAVNVTRKKGIKALRARDIAEELGVSTQPVFSCFANMEEAKTAVRLAAENLYNEYARQGLQEKVPFFGFGRQYIRFAQEEPELYKLLFLTSSENSSGGAIAAMERSQEELRPLLMSVYHITAGEADRYFRDMWLVGHGIATLCVTGGYPYSDAETEKILTGFSLAVCKAIKEVPGFVSGDFDRDNVFRRLVEEK